MGGLFAANLLHRSGWQVQVLEKSTTPLTSRGTGIATHAGLMKVMELAGARFGDALGISREEMMTRKYLPHTKKSVEILKDLASRNNPAEGLAALYAYESQIPEVCTTKIEGLKNKYNLDNEDALVFFEVHEHADEIHREVTREALVRLCTTNEDKQIALDAAREAADALNLLLDGVYETYCVERLAA